MNEDIYQLSEKEGRKQLLELFREFDFDRASLIFREVTIDGVPQISGTVEFFYEDHATDYGLQKQEFVDFKKADRLEKLLLEFGDVRI